MEFTCLKCGSHRLDLDTVIKMSNPVTRFDPGTKTPILGERHAGSHTISRMYRCHECNFEFIPAYLPDYVK